MDWKQLLSESESVCQNFLVKINVLPIFDTVGIVPRCQSAYNMVVRKRVISHERLYIW